MATCCCWRTWWKARRRWSSSCQRQVLKLRNERPTSSGVNSARRYWPVEGRRGGGARGDARPPHTEYGPARQFELPKCPTSTWPRLGPYRARVVLIFRCWPLGQSSLTCSVEEVPHFLHADRAIFVSVHRFKDSLVSCLKLLQRDCSVTVGVHQRENNAHGKPAPHTSGPHRVPAHHTVPAQALPHAAPHHAVAWCIGVNLVGRVLLRLLQLLHDRVVGIFLSARPCSATGQDWMRRS
jgi:hypothetical protein